LGGNINIIDTCHCGGVGVRAHVVCACGDGEEIEWCKPLFAYGLKSNPNRAEKRTIGVNLFLYGFLAVEERNPTIISRSHFY
jgi:hypothetical protein